MIRNTNLITIIALGAICMLTAFGFSYTSNTFPDEITVKGEVLDMNCYMTGEKSGPEHKKCAQGCLSGDAPVGLLTADKTVYLLIKNNANTEAYNEIRKHAAETVEVTGQKLDRKGVTGLVVSKVKY